MVTVIHNDIDQFYLSQVDWIRDGITKDAVRLCARQWKFDDMFNRYYNLNQVINYRFDYIKPLKKW